jgi:hypothetical protein
VDSHRTQSYRAAERPQPRSPLRTVVVLAAGVLLGISVHFYGYLRTSIAALMFGLILTWGVRKLVKIANSPPDPELTDVKDYGLRYVCSVCGLELKVEIAARDKAPTHCGEAMVLNRDDGRPPLHPV